MKWGIWAERKSTSKLGAAQAWCKDRFGFEIQTTKEEAEKLAEQYRTLSVSKNIRYEARPFESQPGEK